MWRQMSGLKRAQIVTAATTGALLVSACGSGGSGGGSEAPETVAPVIVAADAKYSESEVPFEFEGAPTGLAVAPNGDLYVLTTEGLEKLSHDSSEQQVVVPDLPSAFGFAVTDTHAIVGYLDNLEVVDLSQGTYEDRPVANVGDIWGVTADADGNVYVTGKGRPDGRVIRFDPALSDPRDIPFPGLSGNASIAAGPDGTVYVVDFFQGTVVASRPGEEQPAPLELEGADGPNRVAVSGSGDLYILVSDDPGSFSSDPLGVRLLRYPVGTTSPVELAAYETDVYHIAAGADGAVYYTQSDGDGYSLIKLTPQQ